MWSQGRAGAHHIHEIYGSLRGQFQNASDAFEAEGINMRYVAYTINMVKISMHS
jgi:hypothetical protein